MRPRKEREEGLGRVDLVGHEANGKLYTFDNINLKRIFL